MSKNTSCIPSFRLNIAALRAIVLLCISSSLVFSNISWAQKPTQEEITNLIEKLNTNDELELKDTVREFRKIGKDAVPTLVKTALKNENLQVQISAKHILESSNHEIVADELIKTFGSTDLKFRRRAIKWFNEISWNLELKAAKFVPQLIKLLEDEDNDVRQSAASALGRIGEKAATYEAIKALAKLLEDEDVFLRQNAIYALNRMGERAATDEAIKALAKILNDKDSDVRKNAIYALKSMGEKAATDEVIKALTKLLSEKDSDVLRNAANALAAMRERAATDEVIKALTKLLNNKDSNASVRENALYALAAMGERAATDEVVKILIKLLNDKNVFIRRSAAKTLGAIVGPNWLYPR